LSEREIAYRDAQDTLAVKETIRGNRNAFTSIVEHYTPLIYSLAFRMLGRKEDAEEETQEIFLKVFKSLKKFNQKKRFYPWLYTIAVNHIRSCLRKRKHLKKNISYDDEIAAPGAFSNSEDPNKLMIRREAEKTAGEAIKRLKPEYREVFVLRQIEGLSVSEAAEILGIPEGTVKSHLYRARNQLKDYLTKRGWR